VAYIRSADLESRVLAGDTRAIARLLSRAESGIAEARPTLDAMFAHAGRAHVVGITGVPGSGKSTLVAKLAAQVRSTGRRVAVVAVDPSSPFSGGAILGDRIRMGDLAGDAGIFVRSMATRGALGGLANGTLEAVDVLDAAGFDMVMIETVGVGQDEVDVARAAHTTVVVSAPGLGDDIQAIKSGLLEVADVLVVNKADREGADRTERDLMHMLDLRAHGERKEVEIVRTVATRGTGIAELATAIEAHRQRAWTGPDATPRARARTAAHLGELVRALLADRASRALASRGGLTEIAQDVVEKPVDPWTVAEQIVSSL